MPQEDIDDLNLMNLTETKFHRAPTSESLPYPLPPEPPRIKYLTPALFGALAGLIAVVIIYRLSVTPSDAS